MSIVKTEALVLGTTEWRESSQIARVFSRELGKLSVVAKGARRVKSRTGGGLKEFAKVDLTLFLKENAEMGTLREVEVLESHAFLGENLEKFAVASVFLELVDRTAHPRQPSEKVYTLMSIFFENLDVTQDAISTGLQFLLRLIGRLGYTPNLSTCVGCGGREHLNWFSSREGGVICKTCMEGKKYPLIPLKSIEREAIAQSLSLEVEKLLPLSLNESQQKAMYHIVRGLINHQIEVNLKSLRFFEDIAWVS